MHAYTAVAAGGGGGFPSDVLYSIRERELCMGEYSSRSIGQQCAGLSVMRTARLLRARVLT